MPRFFSHFYALQRADLTAQQGLWCGTLFSSSVFFFLKVLWTTLSPVLLTSFVNKGWFGVFEESPAAYDSSRHQGLPTYLECTEWQKGQFGPSLQEQTRFTTDVHQEINYLSDLSKTLESQMGQVSYSRVQTFAVIRFLLIFYHR